MSESLSRMFPKTRSAGRTGFQARRQFTAARSMQAVRALLDHADRADAIAQIALVRIHFLRWHFGLLPIEASSVIGTGGLTISTADAPVVVHDNDAVFFLPCRFDGADIDAGRRVALLTLDRQIEFTFLRHDSRVRRRAIFHLRGARWHLEDTDVRLIGCSIVVVLVMAGLDALAVSVADTQIDRVDELGARDRTVVRDHDVDTVLFLGFGFQPRDHFGLLLIIQFGVVLL